MTGPVRTVASAPSACEVCEHHRQICIVAISGWLVHGFAPCPHCTADPVVEIRHYPYRTDKPRGDVA